MIAMYERTHKESHLDTIWYEIDMLGHCFSVLVNDPPLTTDLHWNLPVETEKEGNGWRKRDVRRFEREKSEKAEPMKWQENTRF